MAAMNRDKRAQNIRSPRSAAIAGLIFSFLLMMQMALASTIGADVPENINRDLLRQWSQIGTIILGMVPFSGIAFLWFTGVIRDWLGEREDRFFSTVFFGSGIIYVVMLFVYAGVMGAVLGTYSLSGQVTLGSDVLIFGFSLVNELLGNYALRIAAVYMFSIGSLLTRTHRAPQWLIILTFLVATGFLLFAGTTRWARYIFPAWVTVISIFILVANYLRQGEDQTPHDSSNIKETQNE